MALPHEGQRLSAVERLLPGREVCAGEWLVDRGVEADVHPANRVRKKDEAEQANLRVVVYFHAGEVIDGVDKPELACACNLLLECRALWLARGDELLAFGGGVRTVDTIDLHVSVVVGVYVRIARDGDCRGPRTVVGHTDNHDGVRVDLTIGDTCVEVRQLRLAQGVALGVSAGVRADQQDVHRSVELVLVALPTSRVDPQLRGAELIADPADSEVADGRHCQRNGRQHRKGCLHNRVPQLRDVTHLRWGGLDVARRPQGVSHRAQLYRVRKQQKTRAWASSRCFSHFWMGKLIRIVYMKAGREDR